MENLNSNPYMHPNFRLLLLAIVSALLLLSVWLLAHRTEADKTMLASTVGMAGFHRPINNESIRPLAARVEFSSLDASLEELLKGPTAEQKKAGAYTEIPEGTHLIGYSIQGHVVTVNLSKEFKEGAGATSAIQRVEELKQAVRRVNPNYRLRIAVEGKPLKVLTSDGLELDKEI